MTITTQRRVFASLPLIALSAGVLGAPGVVQAAHHRGHHHHHHQASSRVVFKKYVSTHRPRVYRRGYAHRSYGAHARSTHRIYRDGRRFSTRSGFRSGRSFSRGHHAYRSSRGFARGQRSFRSSRGVHRSGVRSFRRR